ncbi:MAG TPA: hypothetical protein VM938_14815 [Acidimicrobiales bacterium]|nr:hypothetical protein [Acidimicrobiales bacterium]
MKRAALLLAVALAGCSTGGVKPLPAPPTTKPRPSTTAVPDYSGVMLKEVPGRVTSTIPLTPGRATINGVVAAPDGAVPGAIVHFERLVDDGVAFFDLPTAPDGTFALPNIKGGRWRVRAFRAPDLALVKPELFFLEETETKTLTLRVERYQGVNVGSALAPDPPVTGEPANLLVQVTLQSVDAKGIVRAVPVPGVRVELVGQGDWRIDGNAVQLTDSAGRALWRVRCQRGGQQPLSVFVGDDGTFPLKLPDCVVPPPTTTSSSTTTTKPTGTTRPTSSTSSSSPTTEPED